jgi:DNA-binding NtrC family response regulator
MDIIGISASIKRIQSQVTKLSRGRRNVVVVGEPGVGKAHVAEAIHYGSKDGRKPCVRLNIGAIDPSLLRRLVDLVTEKGEFYNPIAPEHGNFKLVGGSTLILEDLERGGLSAQKLVCELLALCRKGERGLRCMILAEHPLTQAVRQGNMLDALLAETRRWETIKIPPLRERKEDIPPLVEYFVKLIGHEQGIKDMVIDSNAVGVLIRQEWKENVQELKRMIERSIVLTESREVFQLPAGFIDEHAELSRIIDRIEGGTDFALDDSMEIIEKGLLLRALEKVGFNQTQAARALKITEDTLRYRMRRLGIPTARKGTKRSHSQIDL